MLFLALGFPPFSAPLHLASLLGKEWGVGHGVTLEPESGDVASGKSPMTVMPLDRIEQQTNK